MKTVRLTFDELVALIQTASEEEKAVLLKAIKDEIKRREAKKTLIDKINQN